MYRVISGDPPSLSRTKWSDVFVDFVNKCLVKEVESRPSAADLMNVRRGKVINE